MGSGEPLPLHSLTISVKRRLPLINIVFICVVRRCVMCSSSGFVSDSSRRITCGTNCGVRLTLNRDTRVFLRISEYTVNIFIDLKACLVCLGGVHVSLS